MARPAGTNPFYDRSRRGPLQASDRVEVQILDGPTLLRLDHARGHSWKGRMAFKGLTPSRNGRVFQQYPQSWREEARICVDNAGLQRTALHTAAAHERWTDAYRTSSPMTWIETCSAPDLGHLHVPVIGNYLLNLTFTGRGGHANPQSDRTCTASFSALTSRSGPTNQVESSSSSTPPPTIGRRCCFTHWRILRHVLRP